MPPVSFDRALGAYARAGQLVVPQTPATAGEPGRSSSFATFLAGQAASAVATGRAAEQAALDGLSGKASAQSVVEAITAAELTLQQVMAVRDRVIAAYQEILRMPI
jgi:flagellar hook-basal body complex protein FliE